MGSRRKTPSLDDAGYMIFQLTKIERVPKEEYNDFPKETKRHYVKLAIEIWREVEKCI